MKRGYNCEYPVKPPKWHVTMIPIMPVNKHSDLSRFPLGQQDFQFYLCAGAPVIAQWQCPSFWLIMLPNAGERSSAIRCALLAMSVSTQKFINTAPGGSQLVMRRGDTYYGQACSMLGQRSNVTVEEGLNTSFALWCYDWFCGRQSQSFIHANAAVKLFQTLDSSYTRSSASELSKGSHHSMIEVARAFFHDMHFPLGNSEFLRMLEKRARPGTDFVEVSNTIRRPMILMNPFAELATPTRINSFFWIIIVADSKQALHVIQQALDHCADQCAHNPLPRSREQETFTNQIRLFQLFCQTHLSDTPDRYRGAHDESMSEMLDLIQANMQLIANEHDSSRESRPQNRQDSGLAQQGIHCYLGVLGLIGQQAQDPDIRSRAFSQITFHGR